MLKILRWSFCLVITTTVFLLSISSGNLFAGDKIDLNDWILSNREVEVIRYKGKEALHLKKARGSGIAILKDVEFVNGVIELDIAAVPRFTGLVFRVRDDRIYEGIYFRPQNSREPVSGLCILLSVPCRHKKWGMYR